jgi:hypothetical protein
LASSGKNFTGRQRDVERLGYGRILVEQVPYTIVARLDCQDASSSSQDVRVLDEVRSTQIRADANTFYGLRGRQRSRCSSDETRNVELATLDRCSVERQEDGLGPIDYQKMKTEE